MTTFIWNFELLQEVFSIWNFPVLTSSFWTYPSYYPLHTAWQCLRRWWCTWQYCRGSRSNRGRRWQNRQRGWKLEAGRFKMKVREDIREKQCSVSTGNYEKFASKIDKDININNIHIFFNCIYWLDIKQWLFIWNSY